MSKLFTFFAALLCATTMTWAQTTFLGSGNSADPYLLKSSNEWEALAKQVAEGKNFQNQFFRLSADIDTKGIQVGSMERPFCGVFDGDNHTLTFTVGDNTGFNNAKDPTAPFGCLRGAIVRHVKTTGTVYTNNPQNGGIAVCIDGEGATRGTQIVDCRSDIAFFILDKGTLITGGLIGKINSNVTVKPVLERCVFNGTFGGWVNRIGGLVGLSEVDITFKNCMFDPVQADYQGNATFVNLANGAKATFEDCYCTRYLDIQQGTCVFNKVNLPEGCSYEMVEEPFAQFDGKPYWKSGDHVKLTVPEGTAFNHWTANRDKGAFISDPWRKDGEHLLQDVTGPVHLYISSESIPAPEDEKTLWGVTYRYLSRLDYHYYVSDELCKAKNWVFESDKSDANLVVYDGDGNASLITAITGYDEDDYDSDGVQIHNDLVKNIRSHTHLGLIAPRAFKGSEALKSLYFKDTDGTFFNALTDFDFFIDEEAFKDCPNLEEIKMMQYTTRGDNHWEALKADQVFSIAANAFDGSPKAKISTHRSEYQNFLTNETWAPFRNRIIIYDATVNDEKVNGVKYHYYRDANETKPLTSNDKKEMMDNHLRIWNADYKDFNAADLLETNDDATVYYTYVVGVDNDDIDDADGVMRIYNDMGSNYNYKTLALGRNAIAGNEHVKSIEFYQTNGHGENSHSELKMVIQNGALAGCKNLKELRMFYYVEDGTDHWENLGPQDVIPGDNIFSLPTLESAKTMTDEEYSEACQNMNPDFKVLVSTDRFQEFLDDPNWEPYRDYIEPVEFDPTNRRKDYNENGLNYSYMTNPGGVLQTSQVVSQDVSWWTAPRIAIEVLLTVASIKSEIAAHAAKKAAVTDATIELHAAEVAQERVVLARDQVLSQLKSKTLDKNLLSNLSYLMMRPGADHQWEMTTALTHGPGRFLRELGLFNEAGDVLSYTAALPAFGNIRQMGLDQFRSCYSSLQALLAGIVNPYYNAVTTATATLEAAERALTKATILNFIQARAASAATNTAGFLSSKCWGGSGSYNGDALQKGMRENIKSNIHQVSLVGGGYIITTPSKNIVYHTYIKSVDDTTTVAKIYGGFDDDGNAFTSDRTMTFAKKAFRDKKKLTRVEFYANDGQTSNASMPMLLTIPDSAFVGCTNLTEFNTLLIDNDGGRRALGPENFILAGDSVFVGLDPEKFHIVIDPQRKQDFLDNASWAPLEQYFTYESAAPVTQHTLYGAQYAYAYENNSIQKVNKVQGHKIEHTIVTGPDNEFIEGNQGAVKLLNDLGNWNNYQLDYVAPKAFYGNEHLRTVSFTDVNGFWWMGDCYTGLDVTLQDSCFAYCKNLANIDLVYMKTDGLNKLEPMTPQQIKIGEGVLEGTTARLKMMPQQVAWFEADTTWAKHKERFLPCLIRLTDPGVKEALEDMSYYDPANSGTDNALWKDYCDLARIGGAGFSWLDGKFQAQHENIYSFGDFKYFENVGLDYVGKSWFEGCSNMGNILLPDGITDIREKAFKSCSALTEIELPQGVATIGNDAFAGCSKLNAIRVRGDKPATLGTGTFHKHDGLKIYVPAGKVADYKAAWSEYADYIVDGVPAINKVVTVTETGQLANKLGLTLVEQKDKVRYIQGPYTQYDSLTVIGPLNGKDLAVIRHMAGADAYDSDWTDGRLRYLNLWNTEIKKDDDHSYNGNGIDEKIKEDNIVPPYLFENCEAIETVILPQSATKLGENLFEDAHSLRRVCVGRKTTEFDTDLLQNLDGIDELVLLTDGFATLESDWYKDPWEAPIQTVFTTQKQLGNYLSDGKLVRQARSVVALFKDDAVTWALADKSHFFPTAYLENESVEGIFNDNADIKKFDDFNYFTQVKRLDNTFAGNSSLTSITLPDSIEYIGASAFSGCTSLETISVSCDSVPTLEADAFESLPADFKIYVPKRLCKLYRETWAQYADHINVDERDYGSDDIITVTVTEPNKLAEALGLTIHLYTAPGDHTVVDAVRGDYTKYRKLKVVGPISGADIDVLKYMAGYCPWLLCRNYAGRLEYIDLYDADIKATSVGVTGYTRPAASFMLKENVQARRFDDNVLATHAFLRAYNLKTLILPRTCREVEDRALQECEGLEVLVVGDSIQEFSWSALDDDAMLTRMYILSDEMLNISNELFFLRWLSNNYNPTFDAFYVRPSQYQDYIYGEDYNGSAQRTNFISKGMFEDDESFCAFAAHAAATADDLTGVRSVKDWFKIRPGIRDLTPLVYTAVDSLHTADIQPLTQLEKIVLPTTLVNMEDNLFSKATNLRYVDMHLCDSTNIAVDLKNRGFARLGIDSLQTLVYVPATYGESNGTNIIVSNGTGFSAQGFRLVDGRDYCVPYAFKTDKVENTRTLAKSAAPYSICLPYDLPIPAGAKAYKLSGRSTNELIFTETLETLKALQPYLIWTADGDASLNTDAADIPANGATTVGQQQDAPGYSMRGTLNNISNAEAAELGAYVLQSDGLWHPVKNDTDEHRAARILPYRAYLLQSARAGTRALGMTLEDATGITQFRIIDNDGTARIYDLSGRQLSTPVKGVNIINSKKVIIK